MFLDSTILIDFLRGEENSVKFINNSKDKSFFTSEINIFELITGVYLQKTNKKEHLDKITTLISKVNVLPLEREGSIKAGEIAGNLMREGKKIEETDCLIAGIALSNRLTKIVTRNKEHFNRIQDIKVITY